MTGLTKTVTGMVAALAMVAGIGAAQQPAPSKIDVDQLAERLSLTSEVKKEITPDVHRVNELFSQRAEGQWGPEMREELWRARARIEAVLAPEQRLEFRAALHDAFAIRPATRQGFGINQGHMMGPDGMGFGGGCHGGGWTHYGPMHDGSMRGTPQGLRGGR